MFFISLLVGCFNTPPLPNDPTPEIWQQDFTPIEDVPEVMGCLQSLTELPPEYRADAMSSNRLIVVLKRQRKIALYQNGKLANLNDKPACFDISLGSWPYESKVKTDYKSTPEGWYKVARKRTEYPYDLWPSTSFYKALHVSYPERKDVESAREQIVIDDATAKSLLDQINQGKLADQNTAMGGQILIHGWDDSLPSTFGCVGMRNRDIDILFDAVDETDRILILPWVKILYTDGSYGIDSIPEKPIRKRKPTP